MISFDQIRLGAAALAIVVLARNIVVIFSSRLTLADSFSFFLQTICVIILATSTVQHVLLPDVGPADDKTEESKVANSQDAFFKWFRNKVKGKRVTLEENLSARWKLNKNVISKVSMYVEYILRDFIRPWYFAGTLHYNYSFSFKSELLLIFILISVTSDDIVIFDITTVIGNAFGMLINRGRLGLNPITFVFDKSFHVLNRMLW